MLLPPPHHACSVAVTPGAQRRAAAAPGSAPPTCPKLAASGTRPGRTGDKDSITACPSWRDRHREVLRESAPSSAPYSGCRGGLARSTGRIAARRKKRRRRSGRHWRHAGTAEGGQGVAPGTGGPGPQPRPGIPLCPYPSVRGLQVEVVADTGQRVHSMAEGCVWRGDQREQTADGTPRPPSASPSHLSRCRLP